LARNEPKCEPTKKEKTLKLPREGSQDEISATKFPKDRKPTTKRGKKFLIIRPAQNDIGEK